MRKHSTSYPVSRMPVVPQGVKGGYTLVELMLAMGIFMILFAIIMRVFSSIVETRLDAEANSALTQDSQYLIARLAYDISRASAITLPLNPGDSGSTLRLTIDGQSYAYTLNNARITLTTPAGTSEILSSGSYATALTFTHRGGTGGAQTITYDATLQSTTELANGPVTRSVHGTAGTR